MPDVLVKCHLGGEMVDPREQNLWQATSVWSRSGRIREGGSKGGSDRVVHRTLDLYACDYHVQQLKAGRLGQGSLM